MSKTDSKRKTVANAAPGRRSTDLTDLLKASRNLSNILDHQELYSAFADIVQEKIPVQSLSLFVYYPTTETFKMVLSHVLGNLNFKFQRDDKLFWQNISDDKPFSLLDDRGKILFPEVFEKYNLKILQSKLWIPLVMRGEVIGLLTVGEKINNQSFDEFELYFLKQIGAHAAICINTCRLYEQRKREKED